MKAKTRGQALVETALVIGLVVLLVVGGMQLLYALYTVRNVRAAAEDAVSTAAVYGGDTEEFRERLQDILQTYRLVPTRTTVIVDPPQGRFLEPLIVRVEYSETVRVYGLFSIVIPPQEARALSQKDFDEGW
ncbi:MAG: TadE/TadG family type IV pilus assembly protein [Candidatus Micrarchaeaceae archaeon]